MLLKSQQKHLEDILMFHFEYMPRFTTEKEKSDTQPSKAETPLSPEPTEVLEE